MSYLLDQNFCRCISVLLSLESGYVNDPRDPGGETNWGISKRSYPSLNIKAIVPEQAAQIYYTDYWIKCQCDKLAFPLAGYVFVDAVNMGQAEAVKLLQQTVGVQVDGVIGPVTLNAANKLPTTNHYLYLQAVLTHYRSLPGYTTYGHGWENRLLRLAAL